MGNQLSDNGSTLARYRTLQGESSEGVRGLVALASRALKMPFSWVFLLDAGGFEFESCTLHGADEPMLFWPLARFLLAMPGDTFVEDLRESALCDEKAVCGATALRAFAGGRVRGEGGELLGVWGACGPAVRLFSDDDRAILREIARQFEGWLRSATTLQALSQKKQSEALRRELLANVNHEFRTPLAVIQASLRMLSASAECLSDDDRELLHMAQMSSDRLARLIDDTLALQTLEAATDPMEAVGLPGRPAPRRGDQGQPAAALRAQPQDPRPARRARGLRGGRLLLARPGSPGPDRGGRAPESLPGGRCGSRRAERGRSGVS